jgi:hypothetical protein
MNRLVLERLVWMLVLLLVVKMSWIPPGFLSRRYYESERYSNCFVLVVRVLNCSMISVSGR